MNKFIGIDLHSNNNVGVVIDDEDRVIFERRLPNELKQFESALSPHRDEVVGFVFA